MMVKSRDKTSLRQKNKLSNIVPIRHDDVLHNCDKKGRYVGVTDIKGAFVPEDVYKKVHMHWRAQQQSYQKIIAKSVL